MKPRVMVMDDLDSARQMVKRALSRSYDVYDFGAVADALPALDRAEFDCVVTDLRMPGIDGPHRPEEVQREAARPAGRHRDRVRHRGHRRRGDEVGRVRLPQEALRAGRARAHRRARGRAHAAQARERAAPQRARRRLLGAGDHRPLGDDARDGLGAGAGGAHGRLAPRRGRERHRQGHGGARHPRDVEAGEGRLCRAQHERHPRAARRVGAVRPREGRLHRRRRLRGPASSPRPRAGRSSSTRSGSCTRPCRRSSCASCRTATTSRSARAAEEGGRPRSSARRTKTSRRTWSRASSARTSTTGSGWCRCGCRRSASARRTSRSSSST